MKKLLALSLALMMLTPLTASAYWYAILDGDETCDVVNTERSKAAAKTHNKDYLVFKTHTAYKEYLQGVYAGCDVTPKVVEPEPIDPPTTGTWTECAALWGFCNVDSASTIRIGKESMWHQVDNFTGGSCNIHELGWSAIYGDSGELQQGVVCEVLTGDAPVEPIEPVNVPATCAENETGTPPNCVSDVIPDPIDPMPPMGHANPNDGSMGMTVVDTSLNMQPVIGFDTLNLSQTSEEAPYKAGEGSFRIACANSHMSNDDPIVHPNEQGVNHHHTFFGNTSTNYATDAATLSTTGNSTCNGGIMNRSAYWVMSMIDTETGKPLVSKENLVYYKTRGTVTQPPLGLMIIAKPQLHGRNTRYTCNNDYGTRVFDQIPNCSQGSTMQSLLVFPDCWDGVNLDSPDHQSHMAYATYYGECPTSHPVLIPQVSYNVHYDVTKANGTADWRLSSDPIDGQAGATIHGDWINGWQPELMKAFIDGCLNAKRDCHAHLLGDGRAF